MKLASSIFALMLFLASSISFAELRGRGGHFKPSKPSSQPASAPAAAPKENEYGKTPADKSVTWEYTMTLSPGSSLEEIRKIKKELRSKGASFTWGSADEPVFGVKTYLSEDELKGLSQKVATVEGKDKTKNFTIWFNPETNWADFKKELSKNRMQVTFIAGDVNHPVYIGVKSAVLHVGEIYALVGKYIGGNGDQPGVQESN